MARQRYRRQYRGRAVRGFAADGVAPEAGAVGALYLHDIAVTACGENALLVAGLHAFDFAAQLAILFFEDQNARDTGKIDASSWLRR